MQPLSSYSMMMTQINIMSSTAQTSSKLSQQLSNNQRALDLADNPDRTQVLDLTSEQTRLSTYSTSCTLGLTTTSLYDNSLKGILTIAQKAFSQVEGLLGHYTGLPSPAGSTNQEAVTILAAFNSMGQDMTQSMSELGSSLNEQTSSGAFLYGGLRYPTAASAANYTLPPVADLTKLPYFVGATSPAPPTNPPAVIAGYAVPTNAVDPPAVGVGAGADLPTYDSDFPTTRPGAANAANQAAITGLAWGNHSVTIDDNQSTQININSTNQAFQDLINGLRAAKTAGDLAGSYTPADRDKFLNLAFSNLNNAVNGIEKLQNQNSLSNLSMTNKSTNLTSRLNVVGSNLNSLVSVDTTTVTVQLASVNNQLQASYKATASLLGMSLMNYLK